MLWYCRHAVLPDVVVVGVAVQDAVAVAMGQRGGEEIGEGEAPLVDGTPRNPTEAAKRIRRAVDKYERDESS
jgi:hypothetical protein